LFDLILLIAIFLLFVTIIASTLYYKEIRKVQSKYEEAKDIVGDVIVSFNADIQGERQKLSAVSNETRVLLLENKRIQKKVEDHDGQLNKLAGKIEEASGLEPKLSAQLEEMRKNIHDLSNGQRRIDQRVMTFEQLKPQVSAIQETKIKRLFR